MGSFFSDTFFKSFLSKYVYVEAGLMTVAPSISTLSRIYSTMYCTRCHTHSLLFKTISDNSFLTRPGTAIIQYTGARDYRPSFHENKLKTLVLYD